MGGGEGSSLEHTTGQCLKIGVQGLGLSQTAPFSPVWHGFVGSFTPKTF